MLFSLLGRDSRRSALQNIPSHASDMHICLHVSTATFSDVFGFNERDPAATNAIAAVMTHFKSIVQIRLSFNLYYSLLHSSNYSEDVRQLPFRDEADTHRLCCNEGVLHRNMQNNRHQWNRSNAEIVCII